MGQDGKPPKGTPGLRERAEARLQSRGPGLPELPLGDMRALVHELQVHQIELELQNDALCRSQIALEAANKKYNDFYELAPAGFMTLDGAGIIREVNLTAASQLGMNRDRILSTPLAAFVEGEDIDRFRLCLKAVFQEPESRRCEVRLKRPDGGNFFARLDGVAATNASGERVCLTSITDLSELKQAEQKLHASERLFASFVGHLPSVAVIRDLEGRYLFANAAWEQAFQKSREEWLGKTSEELWPPEVAARFREQDRHVLETGEALQTLGPLHHADGIHQWISYRFPIVDPDGRPVMIGINGIDVTEPMATKARLEHLLASGPAAIYTCEPGGDFALTYLSENVETLVGWKARDFLADASFWLNHLHSDDRPPILAQLEFPWPEDHRSLEYRFLSKDGAYRWMHDELKLVRDQDGKPVKIAGAWMDITARRQMEQELQEAHNRLQTLIQAAPLPIVVVDLAGHVAQWNPAAARTFGWSEAEVMGRLNPIVPPGHQDEFRQILAAHVAGESFAGLDLKARRKDGALLDIRLSSAPLSDAHGDIIGGIAVAEDITPRKLVQEALRESEAKFRASFDQAPIGAAIVSLDYRFQRVNDELCRLTGYSAAELTSRTFLDITHPDDQAKSIKLGERLARREIEPYPIDKRYIRQDGEVVWVRLSVRLVKDAQGAPQYFLGMMEDITERKTLEAQLHQAQKMEAVGRLAGGVAHDFNNLLMAIMGYGELIRSSLMEEDPLYKYSEDILKASERAASLTQQLLAFSRRQVTQPQVLNLNRVAVDLEKMLGRLIGEHIRLEIVADPALGPVKADPGQMNQIIMNLAINARDAMPAGGRLILATTNIDFTASHQCYSAAAPPGPYVKLAVSDTGSGMDGATLNHLFEPFFTTKEKGKGTGLGLPMVYGIVKQNHGYVEVESLPGQGTTFNIFLPRLEAAAEAPGNRISLADKLEGSETILVVEDEEALRTLLCRFFRLYGYHVLEARHGGEALLLCERHPGPIHLMVTDVVMPQMSGKELANRLAQLHPEMMVFFMSGYTDSDLSGYGAPDASQHFIFKPFRPMDLVKMVRDSLDASRDGQNESAPP
jgi:two-component system, cell cycle sensor histidine kinase and response regulator CckA